MTADLRAAAAGPLAARLSPRYLEEHCLLPLGVGTDGVLAVAAGRPVDATVCDELTRHFGHAILVVDAPQAEIQAALLATRRVTDNGAGTVATDHSLGDLRDLANEAPVVQFVNVMLVEALRAGASDVHAESTPDGLRVRMRLDGVLRDLSTLGMAFQAGALSRMKLLAGLDIAERRLPQDGRARVRLADRDVDLRVSTLPSLHGESVVLRILDHGAEARVLAELGMPTAVRVQLEQVLQRPNGLVLATGPTGSGKTTTLYAALQLVNGDGVKVVTVEDPVEYQIRGVTQVPVNRKAGLGFASALRSILRHDPDVIMIGEMRDRETAETAIQAALTGHLVFSTLHTNDAPGGVTRLIDMGIEPYLVAATVQAILAQRLVRVLCPSCAAPATLNPSEVALAPADLRHQIADPRTTFRQPVGCTACAGTGFRGRTGLYELFVPSESARAQLVNGATLGEVRAIARAGGMTTLNAHGWRLAMQGVTSVSEVLRVTSEDAE